jgi:hypothetical protein
MNISEKIDKYLNENKDADVDTGKLKQYTVTVKRGKNETIHKTVWARDSAEARSKINQNTEWGETIVKVELKK